MPGQQLIMHKISKIPGRNYIYIFPIKNYYNMKNHVQLNPIIYCRLQKDRHYFGDMQGIVFHLPPPPPAKTRF